MPMEKHIDRWFPAPGPETPAQKKIRETSATRRDSAIRAVNNYFRDIQLLRSIEYLTIDQVVTQCLQLVAVASYLDWDEQLEYARRKEIKLHISVKIREYIDGKL